MAKKNLAQRTYDNTLKAKRWFQGTRNDHNTGKSLKKNIDELLKTSKEDIKHASEKGRFSCMIYYKQFKYKEEVEGYNKNEILAVLKELDKEGFHTIYEDSQDGVMATVRWDKE